MCKRQTIHGFLSIRRFFVLTRVGFLSLQTSVTQSKNHIYQSFLAKLIIAMLEFMMPVNVVTIKNLTRVEYEFRRQQDQRILDKLVHIHDKLVLEIGKFVAKLTKT